MVIYKINRDLMYIRGFYDQNGYICTEIKEMNRPEFVIDMDPIRVIDHNLRCFGFNFKGAVEGSRWLLGTEKMPPIVGNPLDKIVILPTRSFYHIGNIWINPTIIKRTFGANNETLILYENGEMYTVPNRLTSFNNKLQIADQLKKIIFETEGRPQFFTNVFPFVSESRSSYEMEGENKTYNDDEEDEISC